MRTHLMSVTLVTSQLPSSWLNSLAEVNMDLWEEGESSSTTCEIQQTKHDSGRAAAEDSPRVRDLRNVPVSECLVEVRGFVEHGAVGGGRVECERANKPNTREDEQQQRTHSVTVTLATSQFSSVWLNRMALANMLLWEEVQSSVRAKQPNTRADEQQQRTHLVCLTFATSQLPSAWLKFVAL